MTKKRNLLKGVLATTSVMAILAAGAQSASAVTSHVTIANPATFANAAGADHKTYDNAGAAAADAAVAATDVVILGGAHNITADVAVTVSIDLLQHNGQTLTATEDITITNLTSTDGTGYAADLGAAAAAAAGANATPALNLTFGDDKTITINATAGGATIGDVDFDTKAATLELSGATTDIEIASLDNGGTFNSSATNLTTVTGTVGNAAAITALNINAGGAKFKAAVKATNTTVKGDTSFDDNVTGNIQFQANKTATLANNKTITGNITTKTDGEGKLAFAANGKVDGTVGANKFAIAEVNVGKGLTEITGATFTKKVKFTNDAASQLKIGGNLTVDSIDSTVGDQGIFVPGAHTVFLNADVGTKTADGLLFTAGDAASTLAVTGDNRVVYVEGAGGAGNGRIAFDGDNIRAQLTGTFSGNASEITDGKAARTLTFINGTNVNFSANAFNISSAGGFANVLKLGENTTDTIQITGGFAGGAANGALELKGHFVLNGAGGDITDAAVADTVLGADVTSFVVRNGNIQNKLVLDGYTGEIVANTGNVTLANIDATKQGAKLRADGVTLTVATNRAVESVRLSNKNAKVELTIAAGAMDSINNVEFDVAVPTNLVLNAGGAVNLRVGAVTNPEFGVLNLASGERYIANAATVGAINGLGTLQLAGGATFVMPGNAELKIKTLDNGTVELEDGDKVTLAAATANTPTIRVANSGANTITGAFSGKIDSAGSSAVVTLAGDDARTVTFTGARLQKVVMSGRGVTNFATNALIPFTLEVGEGNVNLGAADTANTSNFVVSGKGKILSAANQTFGGTNTNVGASGAALEVLDTAGAAYTITGSGDHFINLSSTDSKGKTTVVYNGTTDVRHVGNIGASGAAFDSVTFDVTGQTVNYRGNAYAKNFVQSNNVNVVLTGSNINGDYAVGDATFTLTDSTINGNLSASTAGKGKLVVSGKSSKVTGEFGANAYESIVVDSGAFHISKAPVSAMTVKGTLFADATMTAPIATYADGAHLAAAANAVVTVDATTTITSGKAFNLDVILSADANKALTNGKFVITALPTLTATDNPNITINVVAAEGSESYAAGELEMADILDTSALKADEAKFTGWVTNFGDGKAIAYSAYTKGSVTPTPTPAPTPTHVGDIDEIEETLDEIFKDGVISQAEMSRLVELIKEMGGATGDNMLKLLETLDEDHAEEMFDRVIDSAGSANTVSVAATTSMNTVMSSIADRVAVVSMAPVAAKAAGDDNGVSYGAWVQAVGGQATQKHTKDVSVGYKSKLAGGVFGFDAEVAEGTLVGIAGAYVKGDVKLKDTKVGDKSDTKTTMVALYAQQMLNDDAFAQVTGAYAVTNVKAKSKRVISNTAYDTASAKFKVKGFSASVLAGYNVALSDSTTLTPMLGFKFGKMDQGSYTEKGSSQNLSVAMKNKNDFIGTIGARLANAMENGDMLVTPELRASLDYSLGSKKAGTAKIAGAGVANKPSLNLKRSSKYTVNVGAGVTAKSGMMEYGVGYDAAIAKKYVGHQGTLKVRVNF